MMLEELFLEEERQEAIAYAKKVTSEDMLEDELKRINDWYDEFIYETVWFNGL